MALFLGLAERVEGGIFNSWTAASNKCERFHSFRFVLKVICGFRRARASLMAHETETMD